MKHPSNLSPETMRELMRLDRLSHTASNRGDWMTAATCKVRWVELYRAAGGTDSPTPPVVLTELQAKGHRTVEHTPKWRIRQKLSPLVAILQVEEKRFRNEAGHENNYFVEHLSCGHENIWSDGWEYPNRSKHRRCKECGDHKLIAAGYESDIAHPPTDDLVNSTLSLHAPLVQANSSTNTLSAKPVKAEPSSVSVIEIPPTDRKGKRDATPAPKIITVRVGTPRRD